MAIDGINANSLLETTKLNAQSASDIAETDTFKETLENAVASGDNEQIKEVCQQFEALFINMLFKEMRKTIPDGGLIEKSNATETFESMLDENVSKQMSETGDFGIADLMYKQLVSKYGEKIDETSVSDDTILNILETEKIETE